MDVLSNPLTIQEIRQYKDKDNFIEGIVSIDLSNIIDTNLEGFLDEISERLVGSSALMDISYSIVGHQGDTLLIKVSGDVSFFLDNE